MACDLEHMYKFLLKWQIGILSVFVLAGVLLFGYLYFLTDIGYYRVVLLTGVVMAIALGILTTIRLLIYFLLKFSGGNSRGVDECHSKINRMDFAIFVLKFLGMNLIAFCYTLGILSLFVFMVNK